MDSNDDDGNYGYDIPEDTGPGFSLNASNKSSHLMGNSSSSDDDEGEPNNNNNDPSDNDADDANSNFAYGAYASQKSRRKRNRSNQSNGVSDKERNLYGVFYDDSSDDEQRRGGRGAGGSAGGGRDKRSRQYDKHSNRQAGLAFVKASASATATDNNANANESTKPDEKNDDATSNSADDDKDTPSWLKEASKKSAAVIGQQSKGTTKGNKGRDKHKKDTAIDDDDMEIDDENENEDENEDINIMDEEEMKQFQDGEQRFKELLAKATTTTSNSSKKVQSSAAAAAAAPNNTSLMNANNLMKPAMMSSMGIGFDTGDDDPQLGLGRHKNNHHDDDASGKAGGLGLGMETASENNGGGLGFGRKSASSRGGLGLEMKPANNGGSSFEPSSGGLGLGMSSSGMGMGLGMGGGIGNNTSSGLSSSMGGIGMGFGGLGSSSSGMGMGGLGSNFSSGGGMGFVSGGGLGLGSQYPKKKKDPNLGKWEKHTKGIGMKLLQKMGYEGSGGLGAKRRRPVVGGASSAGPDAADAKKPQQQQVNKSPSQPPLPEKQEELGPAKKGISRPVEVVVRPHGLGLGFGNFKEQSQLKGNRQIEAEVRGLKLPEESKKKKGEDAEKGGVFDGIDKSLLPSTESLLNRGAGNWRKGSKTKAKKKRKIINYQDILDKTSSANNEEEGAGGSSNKMKIIDMRGTATTMSNSKDSALNTTATVQIGEELLHNVTLLLNTHEGQLRTASYMVKSTEGKVSSLEVECKEIEDRKESIKNRSDKMNLALSVIEEAEKLVEQLSSMGKDKTKSSIDKLDFAMDSLREIFVNLYNNFTREERKSLKFDTTLIPSIVKPLLETLTSKLNPLKVVDATLSSSSLSWFDHLAIGISRLCKAAGSDNEAYALREMIFIQCIIPWVQRTVSSSKWDPILDVEVGLSVFESVVNCACKSFPGAEQEENELLKESIMEEVVDNGVLPKLVRAVGQWRPKLDEQQQIANPLHCWILPWLPHIRNDSMLGTLLSDVRRNLKKTLSFLGKSVSSDVAFVRSCNSALASWKRLFEDNTIFELTSNSVTPRLARALAQMKIEIQPTTQDWEYLHVLFEYFEKGLMSNDDFLSLIEGEVLPAWANALYFALNKEGRVLDDAKVFYVAWKKQFFDSTSIGVQRKAFNSKITLGSDSMVCRYFYGGLKMIQAAQESAEVLLDSLQPPNPTDCNYRIALLRRSKENKPRKDSQPNNAVEARVHHKKQSVRQIDASFQEVVEAFANQHDIAFCPKTGSKSMKDGKPVFMFGDHPVYFDKNVLFALRGSAWRPISLEHLAQSC